MPTTLFRPARSPPETVKSKTVFAVTTTTFVMVAVVPVALKSTASTF